MEESRRRVNSCPDERTLPAAPDSSSEGSGAVVDTIVFLSLRSIVNADESLSGLSVDCASSVERGLRPENSEDG
jgi:hypothetical protein